MYWRKGIDIHVDTPAGLSTTTHRRIGAGEIKCKCTRKGKGKGSGFSSSCSRLLRNIS